MGNEQNYSYWLEIQEGSHVRFGDLPLLIAKAQHHDTNDELTSYLACSNLETELKQAVQSGALTVRNPLGLGPHTFPIGQALQDAVVLAQDLEPLLNDKGIGLRIVGREGVPDTAPVNKTDNGTAQIRIGTSKVLSYVITPHIREIPEELANLPPDAIVEYTDWGGRGRRNAAMFVLEERGRMERQQRGLFTPEEASLCLAEQEQWSASDRNEFLKEHMLPAIERGELAAYSPRLGIRLSESKRQNVREFYNFVKVDELNQWLGSVLKADYQWEVEAISTAKAIETTEPRQDTETLPTQKLDYKLLATPGQLINAFGAFTGMNKDWFQSLKDKPALFAARKRPGRGGKKGYRIEPLFCPLEVMQWLTDPKRKIGRNGASPDTGWRLLKSHFPDVYNVNSIQSPLDD